MTYDICGQPQVAKSLNVASCKMISASGEAFGNSQLAEAKSLDDPAPLTAVVMIEDVRTSEIPRLKTVQVQSAMHSFACHEILCSEYFL